MFHLHNNKILRYFRFSGNEKNRLLASLSICLLPLDFYIYLVSTRLAPYYMPRKHYWYTPA